MRYPWVMSSQHVTVFGGTGFFGRHIVRRLLDGDLAVRIPSRHPDRAHSLFSRDVSRNETVYANVNDDGSVAAAVAGAWGVVNAVSFYVEPTFHSIHVEGAKRIAMLARRQAQKPSCMCPALARMRGRPLLTSVAAAKERRQSLTRF